MTDKIEALSKISSKFIFGEFLGGNDTLVGKGGEC